MERQTFTQEQIAQLRSNPYTASVSPKQIRFSAQFKDELWQAYLKGVKPADFFEEHGYDPALIGAKRIENVVYKLAQQRRDSDPQHTEEDYKKLEGRVKVLEAELDALKKILILANSGKSRH